MVIMIYADLTGMLGDVLCVLLSLLDCGTTGTHVDAC
jgi:hypothetical protein